MKHHGFRWVVGALLLAGSAAVLSVAAAASLDRDELRQFKQGQLSIRTSLTTDARYAHVDEATKRRLLSLQDEAIALIDRVVASAAPLDEEIAAVDDLRSQLEKITQEIELDRPRCKNAPRTGSRLRVTSCMSARESEALRAEAQQAMGKSRGCRGSECGGN